MALVFHRRLAIPLWAIAFSMVAFTAPPTATLFLMPSTTVLAIAAVGIVAIVFLMPGPIPWLRPPRALVRVLPIRTPRSGECGNHSGNGDWRAHARRAESEHSRRRAGSRSHGR
jgi:hypothetical protein